MLLDILGGVAERREARAGGSRGVAREPFSPAVPAPEPEPEPEPERRWVKPPAGSPWEVTAAAPALLAAYGLEPPVRADPGLCVLMAGLSGTSHRYPCPGGGAYVAVLGSRGQFPVCAGHAQQLVNLATADRSRPGLLLLPLHNGSVGFGIPAEFLGPMFAGAASGPNYRPGGGFRRGW